MQVLDLYGQDTFGLAGLPVCGQRATAAIISGSVAMSEPSSFRQFCGAKAGAGATRGHGRVLPCTVEQDRADIVEASRAGLD